MSLPHLQHERAIRGKWQTAVEVPHTTRYSTQPDVCLTNNEYTIVWKYDEAVSHATSFWCALPTYNLHKDRTLTKSSTCFMHHPYLLTKLAIDYFSNNWFRGDVVLVANVFGHKRWKYRALVRTRSDLRQPRNVSWERDKSNSKIHLSKGVFGFRTQQETRAQPERDRPWHPEDPSGDPSSTCPWKYDQNDTEWSGISQVPCSQELSLSMERPQKHVACERQQPTFWTLPSATTTTFMTFGTFPLLLAARVITFVTSVRLHGLPSTCTILRFFIFSFPATNKQADVPRLVHYTTGPIQLYRLRTVRLSHSISVQNFDIGCSPGCLLREGF